jgi:hypothetical protein
MSEIHYEDLMNQLKVVQDRVRACIYKKATGLYLHGRPGTSKTYTVRSLLNRLAVGYGYSNGHLTPIGLFDLLDENRDRIIVLDDVSAIFNQPIALQVLLAALGNGHDPGGVRVVRYKTAKGDRTVQFSGAIVALSNLALSRHHETILPALRDRIQVIHYDPSDEQVIALCGHIADGGLHGLPPRECHTVLAYLLGRLEGEELRPSVRLFVDKALRDYELYKTGCTETHWHDLINSTIRQELMQLTQPTNDLSRAERLAAERRIAFEIYRASDDAESRIKAWTERTGSGKSSFYRRLKELREEGTIE